MALRWLEGFEDCTTDEGVHARLYGSVTGTSFAADNGAQEGVAGESVTGYDWVLETPALVGAVESSWICGFAVRPEDVDDVNAGSVPYVAFKNSDGEQIRFEIVEANDSRPGGNYFQIRVMRGATELATSDQKFEYGFDEDRSWLYFEFKVTINNSTGSFDGRYQWVNKPSRNGGSPTAITWDAASSSIDTQNQSSAGADRFEISSVTGSELTRLAWDDIYVCDNTGSKNNDYLGKVVIEGQDISTTSGGDGTTTDWSLTGGASSTEDALQEPTTGTEDDKRLTSDTTNQVHLAQMASLSHISTGATVVGVRQDIHCRMETTGDLDIAHMFRKTTGTPAQTDAGTDLNVDSTSYEADALVLEDDPNTATGWTVTDINSYQHGVRNDG